MKNYFRGSSMKKKLGNTAINGGIVRILVGNVE
jgi:hypothetical protein